MQCQNCGFENLPDISECVNCHGNIVSNISILLIKPRRHPIRRRIDQIFYNVRLYCSFEPNANEIHGTKDPIPIKESYWFALRCVINPQMGVSIWYKNPWIAAILSFIPGLGQMYKKEYLKGCIYFIIWLCTLALLSPFDGQFIGIFFWTTILSVHAMAIIDAFTSKIITLDTRNTFILNFGIMIILYMTISRSGYFAVLEWSFNKILLLK